MDERPAKRARVEDTNGSPQQPSNKSQKTNGQRNWKSQPQNRGKYPGGRAVIASSGIHQNDVGIFVTSDRGQEKKCLNEIYDLLTQYLDDGKNDEADAHASNANDDEHNEVEASIEAELSDLRSAKDKDDRISLVFLEIQCLSFIRLDPSINPVDLVQRICSDAYDNPARKRSRFIKRLTPMSLMCKTLSGGLQELCDRVLKPVFHDTESIYKFAIRPTIRNNDKLSREEVIKTVADAVGKQHSVDLKNYDRLILVDCFRNVVGISVVDADYDKKYKRFNLAEIYQPSPKPAEKEEKAVTPVIPEQAQGVE